jgi:LytS/YehU family sensor histidine kinase
VFFGVVGFALFGTRARLLQAQAELAVAASEHQRQERLITETELKLLQAQIEPHFLFNTLSNIAVLIRSNPDDAERTLLNLTTLLRSSLNRTREAQTTLREELDIARAYLDIHAIRMRERLQYRIESELSLDNLPLPPMLVQPLIENALKHGVDPLENGGCVSIAVHRTADHLIIAVKENGAGMAEQAPPGTGLRNVRERLYGLYGQAAQLSVSDRRPHGVCAELSIPLAEGTQT